MIESGSIVDLSNNKKYVITDSINYDGILYYISLELTDDLVATDNTVFFKSISRSELIIVSDNALIDTLKDLFVNKFLQEYIDENEV